MPAIRTQNEIIDGIKMQSRAAFDNLYHTYAPLLCYTIRKVTNNEQMLADVLHETFVYIWKNIDQYDARQERIYSWMMQIARTKAMAAETV